MDNREEILRTLRAAGRRITRARSAIIDSLLQAREPLTAPTICCALKREGLIFNRATVYRELIVLTENSVVRQVRFAGKAIHYEINSGHHHHLICIRCNSVKDVVLGRHLENHERKIYERERFKVVSHSLEFYGFCNSCSGEQTL